MVKCNAILERIKKIFLLSKDKFFSLTASHRVMIVIAVLLIVWISGSDIIISGSGQGNFAAKENEDRKPPFSVRVETLSAQEHVMKFSITAETKAVAELTVKTETPGRVVAIPQQKGNLVKPGDPLCKIDMKTRKLKLLQAQAQFAQIDLDFHAAKKLQKKGYASETRVRTLKAKRDSAAATIAEIETDIKNTQILAPFGGIVTNINTEIGDFLNVGSPCVTLSSHDPILVTGHISEKHILSIQRVRQAKVKLITGEIFSGKIRFLAPFARGNTRTFQIEVEVPNPDLAIRSGMSAEILISLPSIQAHQISPQVLTLGKTGEVGVNTVDELGKVKFFPIQIVDNELNSIWVVGLPKEVKAITLGQHYVESGQTVRPVEEK